MLTPRLPRVEEPSPTYTQPLMFSVTTRARSAKPQALATRWPTPAATRSREHCFRSCIDPCGRSRARAERFRNDSAHDPEHLPSYPQRAKFYPRARYHPLGCPREAGDTAYPFAHPLCRDAPSRAPRFRLSCAEPDSCLSAAESARPKIRPVDDCNPTCQKRALVASRGYRVAYQGCPWCAAMSDAVHAASHSLRAALPPVQRAFSAHRSSGAPSPLMLPSPPGLHRRLGQLDPSDRDPFHRRSA